jgi:hypothetical protein
MMNQPGILVLKNQLIHHPLYQQVNTIEALCYFMTRHIYCVWDFMSLLKSLQRQLTCTQIPWLPPEAGEVDMETVRVLNEIVLDEESDAIEGLGVMSHFSLYLKAMAEIGCDTAPILNFISLLRQGISLNDALLQGQVPGEAAQFIQKSFSILELPVFVQAAVFYHARENVLPQMFVEMVHQFEAQGLPCQTLVTYLNRHIQTDGEKHGPIFEKVLSKLYQGDKMRQKLAEEVAVECLLARLSLWDEMDMHLQTKNFQRSHATQPTLQHLSQFSQSQV